MTARGLLALEPRVADVLRQYLGRGADALPEARRELELLVGFDRLDDGPEILFSPEAHEVAMHLLVDAVEFVRLPADLDDVR